MLQEEHPPPAEPQASTSTGRRAIGMTRGSKKLLVSTVPDMGRPK